MKQVLVVLVEDKPGVLNRVASLFRRRNFNIESLVVGPCEIPHASRLTIVTGEEEYLRRNIIRQNLLKLINVIDVQDVTDLPCVIREHALIKIKVDGTRRGEVMDLVDMYRARIVDVGIETLIVEVTGEASKIESIIELLEPFGILELNRAGKVAMVRGNGSAPGNKLLPDRENGSLPQASPKSI
ncbi:MAG: acetolactate synthase small subunit [Candidatus Marinimicrobia bacterium]|nr:acetolactate synthase small subunit [Candidatus Neomarinimicrobiota bacterium]